MKRRRGSNSRPPDEGSPACAADRSRCLKERTADASSCGTTTRTRSSRIRAWRGACSTIPHGLDELVWTAGVEPAASGLRCRCAPVAPRPGVLRVVLTVGVEPRACNPRLRDPRAHGPSARTNEVVTPRSERGASSSCATSAWSREQESNLRDRAHEAPRIPDLPRCEGRPTGLEPASSGATSRRLVHFDLGHNKATGPRSDRGDGPARGPGRMKVRPMRGASLCRRRNPRPAHRAGVVWSARVERASSAWRAEVLAVGRRPRGVDGTTRTCNRRVRSPVPSPIRPRRRGSCRWARGGAVDEIRTRDVPLDRRVL